MAQDSSYCEDIQAWGGLTITKAGAARYTASDAEFTELQGFLSTMYSLWGGLHNWGINRFGGWHGKYMFFQVHPEHRSLEADMLKWTEEVWGSSRKTIGVVARRGDSYRETLLQEHGYVPERPLEYERRFDTIGSYRPVVLPQSFELDGEWLDSKNNMPGFSRDWVVCAATASGRCASFADVLIDREAGYAQVDPVGTDPEFQRRGLATAVLMECFRRLRTEGIATAYIGSAPEPHHSNRLYQKCNPVSRHEDILWVNEVGVR